MKTRQEILKEIEFKEGDICERLSYIHEQQQEIEQLYEELQNLKETEDF